METFLQFLHVLAACVLVGSTIFVGFVLMPVLRRSMEDAERLKFLRAMGARARTLTWISIFVLFTVGFYRLRDVAGSYLWNTQYGRLLSLKIVLAFIFSALALVHDFVLGAKMTGMDPSSPSYAKLRRLTIVLAQIQLVVLIAVLFLAVNLRLYTW